MSSHEETILDNLEKKKNICACVVEDWGQSSEGNFATGRLKKWWMECVKVHIARK